MKYCPYCGAGLDADMRFCPKCGKPFEEGKVNPHIKGKHIKETAADSEPLFTAPVNNAPMKKRRGGIIALVVIVLIGLVCGLYLGEVFKPKEEPTVPFSDNTAAIAEASNSVVMLSCYNKDGEMYATASGFVVFDDSVIVTNYHVIEQDAYRVTAQTEKGDSFECLTVLAWDANKDIAILKAERHTGLSLLTPGRTDNLQKGEKVVAIGSPLGLINSVSTGVFSGYVTDDIGTMLQFTAAISHGSSGGALFNDAGEIIGVTFATLQDGQNINLAVPIEDVRALYEAKTVSMQLSMKEFYGIFEHTPPISTYTSSYIREHYKELSGFEIYVTGYISSILKNDKDYKCTLVESAANILKSQHDEEFYFILDCVRNNGLSIDLSNIGNLAFEYGDYVSVYGEVNEGGEVTAYDISMSNQEYYPPTENLPQVIYTVDDIISHYKDLSGTDFRVAGWVSSCTYSIREDESFGKIYRGVIHLRDDKNNLTDSIDADFADTEKNLVLRIRFDLQEPDKILASLKSGNYVVVSCSNLEYVDASFMGKQYYETNYLSAELLG